MKEHLIADHLILRSPMGDASNYTLKIDAILQDQVFRCALSIASPQFYARINATPLDERAKLSLRRYYNRFCFRATPFGLFSSVSPLTWSGQSKEGLNRELQLYIQPDNHFEYALGQTMIDVDHMVLEPNPTLYRVQKEYRFVRTDTDLLSGKRQYLLQATDFTGLLKRLLRYCEGGREPHDIRQLIGQEGQCTAEEAEEYLRFLRDAQILLPQQRPQITGVVDSANLLYGGNRDRLLFPATPQILVPGRLLDLQRSVAALRPQTLAPDQTLLNVISVDGRKRSELKDTHRQALQDGLTALEKLSPALTRGPLSGFIEQFNQRFEGQQIPLLNLLDPETGINYGPAETEKNNKLLETIGIAAADQQDTTINWTEVHQLLLNAWHRPGVEKYRQITLSEKDLSGLPNTGNPERNNGFGVLFRSYGEKVWIESAGGYHTNSLAGRFTLASPEIYRAAKVMAEHEQLLNPEILFAEILHLADLHTDNVNKRETILDLEIPVTARSVLPKDRQIGLNDLLVQVVNGKVWLSSKKFGKMVLPRLSSAYNHRLNQLPLFRFLADLPYQFGSSVRSLELHTLFPGLRFYPRVVYKQSVLSASRWVLSQQQVLLLKESTGNFYQLQKQLLLPDRFAMIQGDQLLQFDTRNEDELSFFIACIGRSEQLILQEALIDPDTEKPVGDQYNAFILPSHPLELPLPFAGRPYAARTKRRFMPGSEWLYLKIYTSKLGTNALLRQLAPYLKKQVQSEVIHQWFFIRYEDHAPHIRLRMRANDKYIGKILTDLRTLFESKVEQHVIREYQVDTYDRELERYGVDAFEQVEDHFHASSELILKFLSHRNEASQNESYLFAMMTTKTLVENAFEDDGSCTAYYHRRYEQFSREFSGKKNHVELDKKYRSLRTQIDQMFNDASYFRSLRLHKLQTNCLEKFQKLIRQALPGSANFEQLISRLLHMQMNRLFVTESRKQEMIVFYLLYKHSRAQHRRLISSK